MGAVAPSRPRGFDAFRERIALLGAGDGIGVPPAFALRASDVVIAPFAKCGTTWLQQVVHGLRTRGDMDFDDISRVVPWIETARELAFDLETPQRGHPRAFKSHLSFDLVPKGGRYVVSLRDPKDALVSMFHFMQGWFFEPGSVSLEEFARRHFMTLGHGRDYWTHLRSWWERRRDPHVLLLCYEHMLRDLEATVRRVADFAGIAADDALVALVVRQSSREFMLAHADKFDDRMMREHSERAANLPAGSDSAKVRPGAPGGNARLVSPEIAAELDAVWRSEIAAPLGLRDYAALAAELEREACS